MHRVGVVSAQRLVPRELDVRQARARRKVLRGGCWPTSARIARPAYRNFITPDRSDVFAGFRTCAP